MKCNVGKADRALRIISGIVIILIGLAFNCWWGAIGLLPLFTGLIRWCPGYIPFGINTCVKDP